MKQITNTFYTYELTHAEYSKIFHRVAVYEDLLGLVETAVTKESYVGRTKDIRSYVKHARTTLENIGDVSITE